MKQISKGQSAGTVVVASCNGQHKQKFFYSICFFFHISFQKNWFFWGHLTSRYQCKYLFLLKSSKTNVELKEKKALHIDWPISTEVKGGRKAGCSPFLAVKDWIIHAQFWNFAWYKFLSSLMSNFYKEFS